MEPQYILILFQIVVLLFSLSLHEAAHAWMAWRLGDPTARMLGRVTLNPVKHIDPFGTLLIPLILAVTTHGRMMFGWAKPTPITTRNFRHYRRDDILTTLAGPASNLLAATLCLLLLLAMEHVNQAGFVAVRTALFAVQMGAMGAEVMHGALFPIALLLNYGLLLNLVLMAFNLIPLPPLDGSHVFRHMLSPRLERMYDQIGIFGLIIIFIFGGRLVTFVISPLLAIFDTILGLGFSGQGI